MSTYMAPTRLKRRRTGKSACLFSRFSSTSPPISRNLLCTSVVFTPFCHPEADATATFRLAFYYRIFPVLRFRRVVVWFGVVILVYLIAVPIALVFQWYVETTFVLFSPLPNSLAIPFIMLGSFPIQTVTVTVSMWQACW